MNCCIIILNYNNYEDTLECVSSLIQFADLSDSQILVVDNASSNNSCEILEKELPEQVVLLKSEHNRGYANGNNIGIRYAVANGFEAVCILNNDVIITEDFLTPCLDELKKDDTAFVSPRVMDYRTGMIQYTGGTMKLNKGYAVRNNAKKPYTSEIPDVMDCDVLYGSCLLTKTALIKELGMIPEDYFLFYEETDWCYHAHLLGYKNKSVNTVSVIHKGGGSTSGSKSGLVSYLMDRNQVVFVKKYLSKGQLIKYLVFDFFRTIYQEIKTPGNIKSRFSNHMDGLLDRVNPDYSFVYVNPEKKQK